MIISKKQPYNLPLFVCLLTYSLLALFSTGCDTGNQPSHGSGISTKHQTKETKARTHRVEVVTAETRSVAIIQSVSGTLEAVIKIRLYNEESGRVIKLPFHEGDSVQKGTLLVQLDNALIKTDLAKALASKEQASVNLNRLKKLLPKKISTEEEVARAETELDLAIAEEQHQNIRLKRTSIHAPIDGIITRRLYEPGDMLPAHSHIHTLVDPGQLKLEATLTERLMPLARSGQVVDISIDALGEQPFKASISRIHPTINTETHKGTIEILIDPVPEGASIGQFTRAQLHLQATDRLVIPAHVVHYEPAGAYVYRVINDEDGHTIAEKVMLQLGQQYNELVEILSGIHQDDLVVSRGYLGLRDRKKVYVASANTSQQPGDSPNNKASNK